MTFKLQPFDATTVLGLVTMTSNNKMAAKRRSEKTKSPPLECGILAKGKDLGPWDKGHRKYIGRRGRVRACEGIRHRAHDTSDDIAYDSGPVWQRV